MAVTSEDLNWTWVYSGTWKGLCPRCGYPEEVDPSGIEDEHLDVVLLSEEVTHTCPKGDPNLQWYEEDYGLSGLKVLMGFPEDLV